ncbi:MAG: TlpA family protein disulfide reductase [Flavobacterium sp.]|nr:MAG: TlpA family protein disulfide reductase [Flavobacterium sp.]
MKKVFFFLVLVNFTLAHAQNDDNVKFSGRLDSTSTKTYKHGISLWSYNFFKEDLQTTLPLRQHLQVDDGIFKAEINLERDCGFVILKGPRITSMLWNVLFVEKGDSLVLDLTATSPRFLGKGSDKLNYQLEIGAQLLGNFLKIDDVNDERKISLYRVKRDSLISLNLAKLEQVKGTLTKSNSLEILKLNTIGTLSDNYLVKLLGSKKINSERYLSQVEVELINIHREHLLEVPRDSAELKHAFLYTKYVFNLNKSLLGFNGDKKVDFETMCTQINKFYTGQLREELIFHAFLSLFKEFERGKLNNSGILSVRDTDYMKIINDRIDFSLVGAPAFDFEFSGYNNSFVKLSDFKGKVVVVDTWFTGCGGCIGLAEQLDPIINYFKDRSDVVFLGVSVDKSKDTFRKSVASGLYGSRSTIYAYTGGLAREHPMILHYQYTGYPNLLLIDKEGKIITTNPVRPISVNQRQEFINLIEANL